jgi:hypothetical protein
LTGHLSISTIVTAHGYFWQADMLLQPNISETINDIDEFSEIIEERLIIGLDV